MIPFVDVVFAPYIATFLLVFAIMFGILEYVKILGFSRNVNAIIAVVIAFFATAYEPFVVGVQEYMPIVAAVFVVVFFILFLKKAFGGEKSGKRDALPTGFALAILLIVIGIFWDRISMYVPYGFDASNLLWIIGLVIIFAIFWVVYHHPSSPQQAGPAGPTG